MGQRLSLGQSSSMLLYFSDEASNNRHGMVLGQIAQVRYTSDLNSFAVRPFLSRLFNPLLVLSQCTNYTNMSCLSTSRVSSKNASTCSLRTVHITCCRVILLLRQRTALTLSSSVLGPPRHLTPCTPYDRALYTFAIDLLAFLLHVPLAP